jgi:hypothetical protein
VASVNCEDGAGPSGADRTATVSSQGETALSACTTAHSAATVDDAIPHPAVELAQHTAGTEAANGLLKRFLLIACRRARLLPEGGHPDPRGPMSTDW